MNDTHPDPYAVLGVAPTATAQQINRAYRRLLRRHHPDTRPVGPVPADAASGAVSLADLLRAYGVLRDPATRAEHDRNRTPARGPGSARPGPRPASTPTPWPVVPTPEPRRGPGTVGREEPTDSAVRVGARRRVREPGAQEPEIRVGPVLWRPSR
jgi:curved DNA-binding protein CbpA